ncbi:tyrosine-type recombinase/integrase [Flagellimonas pacifica]|uniref:Site-specific recombinase XerD n=1 Tax=Flagellimonas pacifica TaxID=1247520 RepID=A0A285MQW3_9FLAO|nr:site-specific integrase [Allomuricauda parva]SNY99560.1 Site-specific recombinase XerD [Allomuricauda parva]
MARISLLLDTRKHSQNKKTGLYPVVLSVHNKQGKRIRLPFRTSKAGWDDKRMQLKENHPDNSGFDCVKANLELYDKYNSAKKLIHELGTTVHDIPVKLLVENIKKVWNKKLNTNLQRELTNDISLQEWSNVIIQRKNKVNKPGTAKWYEQGVTALIKFNGGKDLTLHDITVTFLKEFEVEYRSKGIATNTISSYLRAIRALYNSAISEEVFVPTKNAFKFYKIPATARTKKRALSKSDIDSLRKLKYPENTTIWHTLNYLLFMFNCRGMNLIDLAKLRIRDIIQNRVFYGRSKTDDPLSVQLTPEALEILSHYTAGKKEDDFVFPIGYNGSTENYKYYMKDRDLVNKKLKIIGKDAGINATLTTYHMRHSWATIARNLGISTDVISEGLGHKSLKTTEIYLKSFTNEVLDEANAMVVA